MGIDRFCQGMILGLVAVAVLDTWRILTLTREIHEKIVVMPAKVP